MVQCEHGREPDSCLCCRRKRQSWQELAAEEVADTDYLKPPLAPDTYVEPEVTFEEIMTTLKKVDNILFGVNNMLNDLVRRMEKQR